MHGDETNVPDEVRGAADARDGEANAGESAREAADVRDDRANTRENACGTAGGSKVSALDEARAAINRVDLQMARLFEQRMRAVASVAEYKAARGLPVLDPERERWVVERNAARVSDEIRPYYARFLERAMQVSRQYQHRLIEGVRVAYSGVEGAFAWVAARRAFPDAQPVAYPGFEQAYEAVANGECDCAVLPVENSTAGEVGAVMDLLFNGGLFVNRMVEVPIVQNLLGVPGASVQDVRKVASHPQALAQCADYLQEHGWETVEAPNTAMAAQAVVDAADPSVAAIASAEAAELYGLVVLDHDINESSQNTTRFAVVSRVQNDATTSSFALMFTVRDEAGSLAKAINVIGAHGFNMTVLRSRPMKGLAWTYYFYIESTGDVTSPEGRAMLAELEKQCDLLKVVGRFDG